MLAFAICCCQWTSYITWNSTIQKKKMSRPFVLLLHASAQYGLNECGAGGGWGSLSGNLRAFTGSVSTVTDSEHDKGLLSAQKTSHHLRAHILRVFTKNTFWNIALYCTEILCIIIYFKWTLSLCDLFLVYIVTMVQWNLPRCWWFYDFICLWLGMYGCPIWTSLDFVF